MDNVPNTPLELSELIARFILKYVHVNGLGSGTMAIHAVIGAVAVACEEMAVILDEGTNKSYWLDLAQELHNLKPGFVKQ